MDIREWRGSTAKLYLALLLSPGHHGTQALLMERMGTTDKATFQAARKQLEEVGKAYREGHVVFLAAAENPTAPGVYSLPAEEKPTRQTLPVVVNPTEEEENPAAFASDSPQTRCAEADRSGERSQQLDALAFAFGKRFPGKPVPSHDSLKRLLQLTGDSAEQVDEAFESASVRPIESPFSYVRAILERQKQAAPVVAIGPPPRSDADDLPPATPEQLAKWRAADAKMKRLGLLPSEEDL
jgi:hypothetical protein